MKKFTLKPVAAALGTTFAVSLAASPLASAEENPFNMTELGGGYMVAGHDSDTEGKCGEGKCGENKDQAKDDAEGKCGDSKDEGEGKCGDSKDEGKDDGEGKCGGDKKEGEGKCGGAG